MPINRKFKIFLNYFLGPLLFIWLTWSIYKRIISQHHLGESWQEIKQSITAGGLWLFAATVLLMLVNWGIESRKWQLLIQQLEPISLTKAYKSVLTGVTVAVNTPNRIGEYGGRILYLKPENRLKAISLNLVSSFSQLIITMLMGVGGLFYLGSHFTELHNVPANLSLFWIHILLYGVTGCLLFALLIYFRLSRLIRLVEGARLLKKVRPYIQVLDHYEWRTLFHILILSFFRFLVFVTQYLLLFKVLHVEVGWLQGFWVVNVLMLVLAIIPTITLTEFVVRGETALTLVGMFSNNTIGIGATTLGIWFINLIIPALIGSLLILSIKIFKDK